MTSISIDNKLGREGGMKKKQYRHNHVVSHIQSLGCQPEKNYFKKYIYPNKWRTIRSLVHKIRLHGRRVKGIAESFSREKLRHAPQEKGG